MPPRPSTPRRGPDRDRARMVEHLRSRGAVRSEEVAEAMGTVARHRFIDDDPEIAYADQAVVVKTDDRGVPISSASQPTIVATMLELAEIEPGQRLLEVGTGTGYNAALLAHLVGPGGSVVTIELDRALAARAERRLRAEGADGVEVVVGDGADGAPGAAPFDRIVVTAGASEVAPAWAEQLADGGRLVVPVVDDDGIGVLRCVVRRGTEFDEADSVPCGFLLLRTP